MDNYETAKDEFGVFRGAKDELVSLEVIRINLYL